MNENAKWKEDLRRRATALAGSRETSQEEYEKILDLLERHIIPDCYPKASAAAFGECELGIESTVYRDMIIQRSGYALLAYEWIRPLARWIGSRRCLEIMAGSGALTHALSQCGVDIIATDDKTWADPQCEWFTSPWADVESMDCLQAIQEYGTERQIIVCSWPYMDDNAYQALLQMRKVNPDAVMLYIGEWEGGATANDHFFDAARPLDDPDFDQAVGCFKQVWGLHDWPVLFK